jgi:hypothetical protein
MTATSNCLDATAKGEVATPGCVRLLKIPWSQARAGSNPTVRTSKSKPYLDWSKLVGASKFIPRDRESSLRMNSWRLNRADATRAPRSSVNAVVSQGGFENMRDLGSRGGFALAWIGLVACIAVILWAITKPVLPPDIRLFWF